MAEVEVQDKYAPEDSLKTYSLTIEEVNDNADELIDLRGAGRYFGAADDNSNDPGPQCRNCHKYGHIAAQCKTVVCLACGALDDHYSEQCPKSKTCSNCGEKGHYRNECKKRQKRIYCSLCNSSKHNGDRCPMIWRSYITNANDKARMAYPFRSVYCYNCAAKGHYGDDCPQTRSSRIPNFDGSAFSGDNLPRSLRGQYWSLFKKRRFEDDDEYYELSYGNGNSNYNGKSTTGSGNDNRVDFGGKFFQIDYDKVNKLAKDAKAVPNEEQYAKRKKSKKEKKKLQKQKKKKSEYGEPQRKRRKINDEEGQSKKSKLGSSKSSSSNKDKNKNRGNKNNLDRLKPKRSGTIFPEGPATQRNNNTNSNFQQSYQVPTSSSFDFNRGSGNYKNSNSSGYQSVQPAKRSGYLPPKIQIQGGGNRNRNNAFDIRPSRSGTLGGGSGNGGRGGGRGGGNGGGRKNNNKSNLNNRNNRKWNHY